MSADRTSAWFRSISDPKEAPSGEAPEDGKLIGSHPSSLRVFLRFSAWEDVRGLFGGKRERAGVLLGRVFQDEAGPFVLVEEAVPTTAAGGGGREDAAWTAQAWGGLQQDARVRSGDRLVVGSFRVRPDGGTAVSPYDAFSAERFFPAWHHVLYIVDPIRQRQGLFHWRDARLHALPGFWVFEGGPDPDEAPVPPSPQPSAGVRGPLAAAAETGAAEGGRRVARPGRRSAALLALLLLLLPWACAKGVPGSLPDMRRDVRQLASSSRRLAEEADALRLENDRLTRILDEMAANGETALPAASGADGSGDAEDEAAAAVLPSPGDPSAIRRPDGDAGADDADAGAADGIPGPEHANTPSEDVSRYVVRQGDTLWSISGRLLGDPYAYLHLAEDNDIPDPDLILPGWELWLTPP